MPELGQSRLQCFNVKNARKKRSDRDDFKRRLFIPLRVHFVHYSL